MLTSCISNKSNIGFSCNLENAKDIADVYLAKKLKVKKCELLRIITITDTTFEFNYVSTDMQFGGGGKIIVNKKDCNILSCLLYQ